MSSLAAQVQGDVFSFLHSGHRAINSLAVKPIRLRAESQDLLSVLRVSRLGIVSHAPYA